MNHKKELTKLLESYENSAEDFYYQQKRYLSQGIVTSVLIPFTREEVKEHLDQAVDYILNYKALTINNFNESQVSQIISLMFELGPCLFEGDQVQINILDEQISVLVPAGNLDFNQTKKHGYTIKIKLLKSGPMRELMEQNFYNHGVIQHLKEQLRDGVYCALRTFLFDDCSENPQWDLKTANEIVKAYGIELKSPAELETALLESKQLADLGLLDLEEMYVLAELLKDEHWHLFSEIKDLRKELREIINSRRAQRIDSPILVD